MFEEIDLAAKLQKVSFKDPSIINAKQMLHSATIGGARALHMEHLIGSLEQGKLADIISIRTRTPNNTPMYPSEVYGALAYAIKAGDVKDVMIHGRILVNNRQTLTVNAMETIKKAEEYQKFISSKLQ